MTGIGMLRRAVLGSESASFGVMVPFCILYFDEAVDVEMVGRNEMSTSACLPHGFGHVVAHAQEHAHVTRPEPAQCEARALPSWSAIRW